MRILLTTFFCLLVVCTGLMAQRLDHRLGYLLVQVEKGASIQYIIKSNAARIRGDLFLDRTISKRLGIYLIKFDHSRVHQSRLLRQLREDIQIAVAQYDHLPTLRAQPDDPLFASQWQWINTGQSGGLPDADIDAELAWDITQGGVTATGDTIVVAIIDDGMDYNHVDIAANAWINYLEVDGNGIDDDGNGYIDDIYGWNAYDDNADVWGQSHGLQVAGMIGAVGNNQIGITGINWNVKMMIIVGGSPESSAIASYAYALEQRILYNESNGQRGAFVVATNSSWGIDFGQPADAPLWCGFYDIMGAHGILSAAATANRNIDIDKAGDLPTACPSEYLLSVTALNHNNERTFSAYGLEHVDFGAPGDNIYTTRRNNGYNSSSGTSFASPIAAGLVALLYAAPCEAFAEFISTNPSAAALYIRDIIFLGVEPISSLESNIRFGGGLNAGNSMEVMMTLCSSCPLPFAINADVLSDVEVVVSWSMIDTADRINARYKPLYASAWDTLADISQPLLLTGLIGCTEYEIEFESICADTSTGFQVNHVFKTDGCCELPANISAFTGESGVTVTWDDVLAAEIFLVQWRPAGAEEWIEEVTPDSGITIQDLDACTFYELRLLTDCDTAVTAFSDILLLRTLGCGHCIDLPYCEAASDDSEEENIDSLIIGPLVSHSGQNGGYILFEDLNPDFVAGETYNVWIRPGFGIGTPFNEQFRIWLDVNQDGVFDEDELLLDSILALTDTFLISQVTIPDSALAGSTRMRVSMAFVNSTTNPIDQPPCGSINFGEIEDYCVNIVKRPQDCPEVDTVFFDGITFTSAFMFWPSIDGAIAYTFRWREVGSIDYTELATIDTTANLGDLEKCKSYEVQIRTVCTADTTSYLFNYLLKTDCDVAVRDPDPLLAAFHIYPNPTTDFLVIRLQALESGDHHIAIYNMQGQRIRNAIQYAEQNAVTEIRFSGLDMYAPGLYFVVVEKNGKTASKKVVKI